MNIKTSDNIVYNVEIKYLKYSNVLSDMFEFSSEYDEDGNKDDKFNIQIKSKIFKQIIIWLKAYDEKKIDEDWYKNYFETNEEILMDLAIASNYLDIREFTEIIAKRIAFNIKFKSPDKIHSYLKIEENSFLLYSDSDIYTTDSSTDTSDSEVENFND